MPVACILVSSHEFSLLPILFGISRAEATTPRRAIANTTPIIEPTLVIKPCIKAFHHGSCSLFSWRVMSSSFFSSSFSILLF